MDRHGFFVSETLERVKCPGCKVRPKKDQVQEKLCTEPNDDPADAFAIASEEGLRRQRTVGQPGTSTTKKEEPVYAVLIKNKKVLIVFI